MLYFMRQPEHHSLGDKVTLTDTDTHFARTVTHGLVDKRARRQLSSNPFIISGSDINWKTFNARR